jgi:outer membrane protein TolC
MDYLPALNLTGAYRVTQNTGWSGDPHSWQLLLTLDWVIYDGGLRRATRLERASQLNETRLRLDRLDRSARQQLRQARRDLETAMATVRTTEERQRLAEETRGQVLRRYRAGLATSLELVEADDAMSQARLALVARQLELSLARLTLLREAGLDPLGREVEP